MRRAWRWIVFMVEPVWVIGVLLPLYAAMWVWGRLSKTDYLTPGQRKMYSEVNEARKRNLYLGQCEAVLKDTERRHHPRQPVGESGDW